MIRIKMYMEATDAGRVNGHTLAELREQTDYTFLRDHRFLYKLTQTNDFGPGIPDDLISFKADFDDIAQDGSKHVAVYVTFAVVEYHVEFDYDDLTISINSYDAQRLAETVIDILSRRYKWSRRDLRRNSIVLASEFALTKVGDFSRVRLAFAEIVWLTVREPSPEKILSKVEASFPSGRQLELVE